MSRDQRFYLADGNTTICVDNTLFKVHRSIVCQDGSTFESMFSVCNAHVQPPITNKELVVTWEGDSDDTPIYLHGDSADEFRDLLWSLYALPHEIATIMSPQADTMKLVNIARMANKYHFVNVETWALVYLGRLQTEDPTTPTETNSLTDVTEIAVLCDDTKLLQIVRTKWKNLIGENKGLSVAINVFERLGIFRDLMGIAYHALMLQGREKWSSDPLITREQRIRLLSGYYTISGICANLPSNPPKFFHNIYCPTYEQCQKAWETLWKEILTLEKTDGDPGEGEMVIPDKNDLIGRMVMSMVMLEARSRKDVGPRSRAQNQLNASCFRLACHAMVEKYRDLESQIPDFFQPVE